MLPIILCIFTIKKKTDYLIRWQTGIDLMYQIVYKQFLFGFLLFQFPQLKKIFFKKRICPNTTDNVFNIFSPFFENNQIPLIS